METVAMNEVEAAVNSNVMDAAEAKATDIVPE